MYKQDTLTLSQDVMIAGDNPLRQCIFLMTNGLYILIYCDCVYIKRCETGGDSVDRFGAEARYQGNTS